MLEQASIGPVFASRLLRLARSVSGPPNDVNDGGTGRVLGTRGAILRDGSDHRGSGPLVFTSRPRYGLSVESDETTNAKQPPDHRLSGISCGPPN